MTNEYLSPSSASSNVELPEAFLERFPLSEDPNDSNIISLVEFDSWCISRGLFGDANTNEKDVLNTHRNKVRSAINSVARGEEWRSFGSSFQVEVYQHGVSFKVIQAVEGFLDAGHKLPNKVQSITQTRKKMLTDTLKAIDPGVLSPELQIEATQQVRNINKWQERAALELRQIEQDFRFLRSQIKAHNKEAALPLFNHDDEGLK